MTEAEKKIALAQWLASRPECVRHLAAEFPPGSRLECRGRILYVVGWTEGDSLIVSAIDPCRDWEGATASKEYLCASHYRPCPHHSREEKT